jgi:hypothetical protein
VHHDIAGRMRGTGPAAARPCCYGPANLPFVKKLVITVALIGAVLFDAPAHAIRAIVICPAALRDSKQSIDSNDTMM